MDEEQRRKIKLFDDLLLVALNASFDCGEFVFNKDNRDEYEQIQGKLLDARLALKEMYKESIL